MHRMSIIVIIYLLTINPEFEIIEYRFSFTLVFVESVVFVVSWKYLYMLKECQSFVERDFPANIIRTNRDDEYEKYLIASLILYMWCGESNIV